MIHVHPGLSQGSDGLFWKMGHNPPPGQILTFNRQSALLSPGAGKESAFEMYPAFGDFEEYLDVILPLVLGADFRDKVLDNGVRARRAAGASTPRYTIFEATAISPRYIGVWLRAARKCRGVMSG
jgi:hypothetical protein